MSARRILLLGNLKGTAMAALEGAARQINAVLTHHSRADEAIRELDVREWRAVLVDITTPGASRFCHEARARRALFNVPLIGMTPQLSDLAFSNAFRWGADDVVSLGLAGPLVARLESLPESIALEDPARGEAVVADADRGRCDVLGRVLANAGYSVRYATDLVSARYYIGRRGVTLFVFSEELGSPPALIEQALAQGSTAFWIVAAKQRHLEELRDQLKQFKRVAVMSAHGPPENVLFALDFLNPTPGALRRSQVRALHGTMVRFRTEGEEEDECGYTYSVSASGMYVRTLLPPPRGNLWLELEPPKAARRVRLLGTVAWSRTFGQSGAETAPPGFGVKLSGGLGEDIDVWLEGFRSLDAAQPDSHVVPEVKFTPQPFKVPLPGALSQAAKAPYVSRKSSPIISIGASEPAKPSVAPTVPLAPPSVSERPAREPVVLSASMAPLLDALTPVDVETAPRTEQVQPRIPRPDPGTLRGSLAPLLNQRLAGELTQPPPAAKVDLSKTTPLLAFASSPATQPAEAAPAEAAVDPARTNGAGRGVTPLEAAALDAGVSSANGPATVEVLDLPAIPVLEPPKPPPKPESTLGGLHEAVSPPVIVLGPEAMLPLGAPELAASPPAPVASPPAPEPVAVPTVEPKVEPPPEPASLDSVNPDPVGARNSHSEGSLLSAEPRRPSTAPPNEGTRESGPAPAPLPAATEGAPPPPIRPQALSSREASEANAALASEAPPPKPAPRRSSLARGATVALGLGAVAAVVGTVWMSESPREPARQAPPTDREPPPSTASVLDAPESASAQTNEPSPAPSSAPAGSLRDEAELAAAEPTAAATGSTPSEAPPLPSSDVAPPALEDLAEDESWLLVTSSVDAAVYVHGIDLGRTNQWLKSRCGMRFIRLGAAPGEWLSEGSPHRLACKQAVTLSMNLEATAEPKAP